MSNEKKSPMCPHTTPEFKAALAKAAEKNAGEMEMSVAEKITAPAKGRSAVDVLTAPDRDLKP